MKNSPGPKSPARESCTGESIFGKPNSERFAIAGPGTTLDLSVEWRLNNNNEKPTEELHYRNNNVVNGPVHVADKGLVAPASAATNAMPILAKNDHQGIPNHIKRAHENTKKITDVP